MNAATLYETDFVAWTQAQAEALRDGRLDQLDTDNLVEEIESMGRRQQAELRNRLAVLLSHLLKWQHRPELRDRHGRSWQLTIKEQRLQVAELLDESPSLRPSVAAAMVAAYRVAVIRAARETGLDENAFPPSSPWTFDQAMAA